MKLFHSFFIILILSCSEYGKYSIDDFNKHPEIKIFLIDSIDLEGYHYFDRAWLHFSFKTDITSIDSVMNCIDSIAQLNNWSTNCLSDSQRVYTKLIKSYPADNIVDTLFFNYNRGVSRLDFKWH